MIYRIENTNKEWMEFCQAVNTSDEWDYRSNTNNNWRKYFLKVKDIQDIINMYAGVGWSLVSSLPSETVSDDLCGLYFSSNDGEWKTKVLDTKLPEGKHKCHCSWNKVWCEGCKCGGI